MPLFLGQQGFERIEHEAVTRIADRVHVQLPALGGSQRRQLLHLLARVHHQAAVARLIAVVLHQSGTATAESAVGIPFTARICRRSSYSGMRGPDCIMRRFSGLSRSIA